MTEPEPRSARRAWLVYTGLRMLVFIAAAGALAVVGLNGYPLLFGALLISSVASLFVLRPQRTALVEAQLARRERRSAGRDARRAQLDEG